MEICPSKAAKSPLFNSKKITYNFYYEQRTSPAYEPKLIEEKIYEMWEKSGYFNRTICRRATRNRSPSSCSANANGSLHIGHALFVTLEDIMIRYNRMKEKRRSGCRERTTPDLKLRWFTIKNWKKRPFFLGMPVNSL